MNAAPAVLSTLSAGKAQETTMRLWLIVPTILVGMVALGNRAEAQNYPWCAQYSGDLAGSLNCGFTTYEQCREDVSGVGGFCIVNNLYQPPASAMSARRPARTHHAGKHS